MSTAFSTISPQSPAQQLNGNNLTAFRWYEAGRIWSFSVQRHTKHKKIFWYFFCNRLIFWLLCCIIKTCCNKILVVRFKWMPIEFPWKTICLFRIHMSAAWRQLPERRQDAREETVSRLRDSAAIWCFFNYYLIGSDLFEKNSRCCYSVLVCFHTGFLQRSEEVWNCRNIRSYQYECRRRKL